MSSKILTLSTPTDTTLVLTRTFNAPRHRVWEAMFTPTHMLRWMLPPPGWTLATCECDPRPSGRLKLTFQDSSSDSSMTIQGTFTEVLPHDRITHTEEMLTSSSQLLGTLTETHTFTESHGITTLQITQTYPTKQARDEALSSSPDQCMEPGYRQLDTLLAQPA